MVMLRVQVVEKVKEVTVGGSPEGGVNDGIPLGVKHGGDAGRKFRAGADGSLANFRCSMIFAVGDPDLGPKFSEDEVVIILGHVGPHGCESRLLKNAVNEVRFGRPEEEVGDALNFPFQIVFEIFKSDDEDLLRFCLGRLDPVNKMRPNPTGMRDAAENSFRKRFYRNGTDVHISREKIVETHKRIARMSNDVDVAASFCNFRPFRVALKNSRLCYLFRIEILTAIMRYHVPRDHFRNFAE